MIVYFSNQFPSPVEPYVMDEVFELRRRGLEVMVCSIRHPKVKAEETAVTNPYGAAYFRPTQIGLMLRAVFFLFSAPVRKLLARIFFCGKENLNRRVRALVHTWLGAYYALLLKDKNVEHIHIHHGYFAAWVGMTAAKILGTGYSITLHGSDLLLHATYLDVKLEHCNTCFTISNFNRNYILERYPQIPPSKVVVIRMGVSLPARKDYEQPYSKTLKMLSIGRLHPVKDHAFLIRACRVLKDRNYAFSCTIAGEGPERNALEKLIQKLGLSHDIQLAGHVPRERLDGYYRGSDLVVLTSRSEGVPLALMEAMAYGKLVLAPRITGIPELVLAGRTGFLYEGGEIMDFVRAFEAISIARERLDHMRQAAREHIGENFRKEKTVAQFAELLTARAMGRTNEDPVLQQV